MSKKVILSILLINFIWLTSCSQPPKNYIEIDALDEQPIKRKHKTQHAYGAWYCPDNFGFPAIDVKELNEIPIVNGRLPTKEETMNGTSLMYFDTTHLKNVKPLDMTMPKLARYYSEDTKKNELIIVIQTAVIEKDTIVGFRYLNGGNGSTWFDEVTFLSDDEIDELESTPFIALETNIKGSSEKVWNTITNPIYTKALGGLFGDNDFANLDERRNAKVQYKYAPKNSVKTDTEKGTITNVWENVYIQVDYNFDGRHYVQKFLISENEENGNSVIRIVSGPYGEDFETQKEVWNEWLKNVKMLSERM